MAKPNPLTTPPLTMEDHTWGCIVRGTRIQIIAAGIVPLDKWPAFDKDRITFRGNWKIAGRLREVMIERRYCPTDTEPGEVWVSFDEEERNCLPRINEALHKLSLLHEEILRTVELVKPMPLSQILAIPGAEVHHGPTIPWEGK